MFKLTIKYFKYRNILLTACKQLNINPNKLLALPQAVGSVLPKMYV